MEEKTTRRESFKEQKARFIEINTETIKNVTGRGAPCPHFSSFLKERENARKRCLLNEYKNRLDEKRNPTGKKYFTKKEAREMCSYFRSRTKNKTKCIYSGNYADERDLVKDYLEEIRVLKEENKELRQHENELVQRVSASQVREKELSEKLEKATQALKSQKTIKN